MADAFTTTSSLGLDQASYDMMAYFALRPELYFDQVATVQPAQGNQIGSSTIFRKFTEMSAATTPLTEAADVDAVAIADSTVTLTLAEYGNVVATTELVRDTAYMRLDPVVANLIGYNAGLSIDTLAVTILGAATNIVWGNNAAHTSVGTIAAADTIKAGDVRRAIAQLRGANVATKNGSYWSFIHPDVSVDLRETTGTAAWSDPVAYSDAERRWNGFVGVFEGARFIETPRAPVATNAGAGSTVEVYSTIVVGDQALAKAYAPAVGPNPQTRIGATTDHLQRFRYIGWYWLGSYGVFRQEAIRVIKSSSSLATNV